MIPTNSLVNQLEAYIRSAEQPLIQLVESAEEVQQLFSVGEQVRAQVTGELPNGRYAVLVKDQTLDLNLPRNTQPGDEIDMRVIANSPRLAFLLPRQGLGDSLGLPTTTQEQTGSTQVALSNTAQFLGDLLSEMSTHSDAEQVASLKGGATALIGGPQVDTAALAGSLQKAFSDSGLFYESHLADWVQGKLDLQALLAEPQAQFGDAAARQNAMAGSDAAHTTASAQQAAAGGAPNASALGRPGMDTAAQAASALATEVSTTSTSSQSLSSMPQGIRDVVQQQLQVLDQRPIVWIGQAWTGQQMKWEIEEDRSQQGGGDGEASKAWNTRIHLELPTLGSIDAVINLRARTQVGVNFTVSQASTASLIRHESTHLRDQMESAGLHLIGQQVAVTDAS